MAAGDEGTNHYVPAGVHIYDCPDGEPCKICPCAQKDDVCFPGERLRAEVVRLRQGLLQCATEAGEDVSGGVPSWPDIVDWAVSAVRQLRADQEEDE